MIWRRGEFTKVLPLHMTMGTMKSSLFYSICEDFRHSDIRVLCMCIYFVLKEKNYVLIYLMKESVAMSMAPENALEFP